MQISHMLQHTLERQFYGFLNLVLRNPWTIANEVRPKSLQTREYQINYTLRALGLQRDLTYQDCFRYYTYRAKVLYDLVNTFADKLDYGTLKKLAETGSKNVKLAILERSRWWGSFHIRGWHMTILQSLSYRERVSRALKTLIELKLMEKRNKRYCLAKLGEDIANQLGRSHYKWVDDQLASLMYYFETLSKEAKL